MFALSFDDFKRKMLDKDPDKRVYLKKLATAMPGTPDYDAYMGLYLAPENETVHTHFEDDMKTVTFYTIITDQKRIAQEVEAYHERIREAAHDADRARATFV